MEPVKHDERQSARFAPAEFVGLLSKLQPRLYSVASSLKQHPDSVHFIVDIIRFESHGRERMGVATSFWLGVPRKRSGAGLLTVAKHFHLPEDPSAALIMVGPGTGVAPFAHSCKERKAIGARGKS